MVIGHYLQGGDIMSKLMRWSEYFRRGHGSYGAYLVSFANFMVIQYRDLISYVAVLGLVFQSLSIFALAFLVVYIPIMTIIGRWDFKRVTPTRQILTAEVSPWVIDLSKALVLMCDNENEEAKKILNKWVN